MTRVAVIIPAYNEEATIASLINQIHSLNTPRQFTYECIVVNDGSTDKTKEIVKKIQCTVFTHHGNLGKGFALYTGMNYVAHNDFEYIVLLDADGQHQVQEIPIMLHAIVLNKADIVIGSRFLNTKGFKSTFIRRIGISFFNLLIMLLIRKSLTDSTNGFRVLNKKALRAVLNEKPHRHSEIISILQYNKHKLHFIEHPVTLLQRKNGTSAFTISGSCQYVIDVTVRALIYRFTRNIYA